MLHDPEERRLFPLLTPEQIEMLSGYGEQVEFAPGDMLFEQGKHPYHFWVILDGEVRITKRLGDEEMLLTVHKAGEFAAEVSILSGAPSFATGHAISPVRALRVDSKRFRSLMIENPAVAEVVMPALTGRVQEVSAQLQQQEKLAALGRMAAGLAHELNNPAAAVRRAAADLQDTVAEAQSAAIRLHAHPLSPAQQALLDGLHAGAREFCASPIPLSPLERSDREDAIADWLDERGVGDGWKIAPTLVAGGITPERLEAVEEGMGTERLGETVRWLAATLSSATLLREIAQSSDRISMLVKSIKQYSHMDQAPTLKETDIHEGLNSTLALLEHKLKHGVEVIREYDRDLPRICIYPGELHQVWTNLIDNAVDAMGGKGHLWIRTRRLDESCVQVEIADDGPGIPQEIQDRIWEPFFTTKGVGEGSGLGLDIARRIVQRRHGGSMKLITRPGDTRFQINLRVAGPPKQSGSASAIVAGDARAA
jgi:signal transduction histidine kinase